MPGTFRANIESLTANLQPTISRLQERLKLPEEAIVSPVSRRNFEKISELHTLLFDTSTIEVINRLCGRSKNFNYSQEFSTELMLKNQVIGTCLFLDDVRDNSVFLFAIIISPKYRKSWATAFLKYKTFAQLNQKHIRQIAFQALNGNPDTMNHARKVGAVKQACDPLWD